MGFYVSLAQVGMEMAVPAGIGMGVDHYCGSSPWGVVIGAVFGLIAGFAHLIAIANRQQDNGWSSKSGQDLR
jgi:F0F1-type ATP synthase assembly protein I